MEENNQSARPSSTSSEAQQPEIRSDKERGRLLQYIHITVLICIH